MTRHTPAQKRSLVISARTRSSGRGQGARWLARTAPGVAPGTPRRPLWPREAGVNRRIAAENQPSAHGNVLGLSGAGSGEGAEGGGDRGRRLREAAHLRTSAPPHLSAGGRAPRSEQRAHARSSQARAVRAPPSTCLCRAQEQEQHGPRGLRGCASQVADAAALEHQRCRGSRAQHVAVHAAIC